MAGQPDNSDRNQIINDTIVDTRAENVDIKEGSSNGVVRANYLGGNRIASKNSADSWIDVKGNGYLIDSNHGVTNPRPHDPPSCGEPQGRLGVGQEPVLRWHAGARDPGRLGTEQHLHQQSPLEVNAPRFRNLAAEHGSAAAQPHRLQQRGDGGPRWVLCHQPLRALDLHTVTRTACCEAIRHT